MYHVTFAAGAGRAVRSCYPVELPIVEVGQALFVSDYAALGYIKRMMYCDLNYQNLKRDRIETAIQRLDAAYHLATGTLYEELQLWNTMPRGTIAAVYYFRSSSELWISIASLAKLATWMII